MGTAVTVARRLSEFRHRKCSDHFWRHFDWVTRKAPGVVASKILVSAGVCQRRTVLRPAAHVGSQPKSIKYEAPFVSFSLCPLHFFSHSLHYTNTKYKPGINSFLTLCHILLRTVVHSLNHATHCCVPTHAFLVTRKKCLSGRPAAWYHYRASFISLVNISGLFLFYW